MRFLGRSPRPPAIPYVVRPPYGEARAGLLARRPIPGGEAAAPPFDRLFAVVADLGLDADVVSVYLLADGTISIYSTGGIHSTGLRGAPRVEEAAAAIVDEVVGALGAFSRVDDLAERALPDRGHAQILVRTRDGDFAADDSGPTQGAVSRIAAMALLLTQLARAALIEGFDRVEAGEVRYRTAPGYRRIRSTLLDWVPAPETIPSAARVAGVAVEIGEPEAEIVTSLFAFADGSTSVYRSDGTLAEGLSGTPGVARAARGLLDSVEEALGAFAPAQLISLPQPGRVQFVARARLDGDAEWTEVLAIGSLAALAKGTHPLSAAFDRANEVIRIAG